MKRVLASMILFLLLLSGCSRIPDEPTYTQVDMQTAIKLMEDETDYVILDVRTIEEFETAHIPDAICIPNEEIGTTPPSKLSDRDQLILIYCRSGNRSKQAAQKLADMGYTNIVEFGGNIDWPGETASES